MGLQQSSIQSDEFGPSLLYSFSLPDKQSWIDICSVPKGNNSGNVEVTKVVWDIRQSKKTNNYTLYFVNTNFMTFHYDFITKVVPKFKDNSFLRTLKYNLDLGSFNKYNYSQNEHRAFILGTLIHYNELGKFCLEINAEDNLDSSQLWKIYQQLHQAVYFRDNLYFKPSSNLTEATAKQLLDRKHFRILSIQEVYKGKSFEIYNKGATNPIVGYLKFIKVVEGKTFDPSVIRATDIVCCDFVPNEMGFVTGIVTSVPQAPLCHVSILSQNRNTLNCYWKQIFNFSKLDGLLVRITLRENDLLIEDMLSSSSEQKYEDNINFDKLLQEQKENLMKNKPKIKIPPMDLSVKSPTVPFGHWAESTCGIKSATLQTFKTDVKDLPVNVEIFATGLVIPFSHYVEHLKKAHKNTLMRPNSEDSSKNISASISGEEDEDYSQRIMMAIRETPIDSQLLKEIQKDLTRQLHDSGAKKLIMRSSTNAEDLIGFNGAGLYLSIVLETMEHLESVIKEIWSSVFCHKAVVERKYFGIPVDNNIGNGDIAVGMAILCQPMIMEDVIGKGVALSHSPIHTDFDAFFVNVQPGDLRSNSKTMIEVTDSSGGIPEQIVVYLNMENLVQEIISRSDAVKDENPVLSTEQVRFLHYVVWKMQNTMTGLAWKKKNCCCDIEFIFHKSKEYEFQLKVLQIRPHNIRK